MKRFSKKRIDDAVLGISNARAVLDGTRLAPDADPLVVEHLRQEYIVEEPPMVEPPPLDDWNQTRRDLG